MEVCCSFRSIAGGVCGFDRKDKKQEMEVVPLLACTKQISSHMESYHFSGIKDEVDLILSRAGVFKQPQNICSMTICPSHRSNLGLGWSRGSNRRCRVPSLLSNHGKKSKTWPKCDRGIGKDDAEMILEKTGIFLQVGSGKKVFVIVLPFILSDLFFNLSKKGLSELLIFARCLRDVSENAENPHSQSTGFNYPTERGKRHEPKCN